MSLRTETPLPRSYPLSGANNVLLGAALFYETWLRMQPDLRACDPVFSLYLDRPGLINARTTFLELGDVTGVKWAETYLEGVNHLQKLLTSSWFKEAFDLWIAELEMIQVAEALERIKQIASSSSPAAFQAAKFIAKQEWKRSGKGRGRPSKEEIKGELRKEMDKLSAEDSDYQRVLGPNLKLVK